MGSKFKVGTQLIFVTAQPRSQGFSLQGKSPGNEVGDSEVFGDTLSYTILGPKPDFQHNFYIF